MIRILSFQGTWTCRHSGACCTSAWPIPVEPRSEAAIRNGVAAGKLRVQASKLLEPATNLPDRAQSLLAHDPAGRCVFFDQRSRLCAIHRDLGEPSLPLACRHFPRVALLDEGSISLSLSHYCPTAAALLFEAPQPVTIVEDPPGFPANGEYDGLDVRAALPPLLRPGVLSTRETYALFEARGVALLTRSGVSVTEAVSHLVAKAASLTTWRAGDGDWNAFARRALAREAAVARPASDAGALVEAVIKAVPDPARRPWLVAPREADRRLFEAPEWELAGAVKRFLAAKLFASWSAYQGNGWQTPARLVEAAHALLLAECARRGRGPLGRDALQEAIRRSDLLLVHLADPAELASRLEALPVR